jgi:hypothetical protein
MEARKFAKLEDRVEDSVTHNASCQHLDALQGIWLNTNSHSGGIVKVVIHTQDLKLKVRVYGAGDPTPFDWGEVDAEHIYSSNIASQTAAGFTAWYRPDHAEIHLQANWNQGLLVLASFTSFKDGSSRSNYFSREFFHR